MGALLIRRIRRGAGRDGSGAADGDARSRAPRACQSDRCEVALNVEIDGSPALEAQEAQVIRPAHTLLRRYRARCGPILKRWGNLEAAPRVLAPLAALVHGRFNQMSEQTFNGVTHFGASMHGLA